MSRLDDEKRAREALAHFHNAALAFPVNYHLSLPELANELQRQSGGAFLDGFGLAVQEVAEWKIRDSMVELAKAGQGRLPTSYMAFFHALSGKATQTSFSEAAAEVLSGTTRDLAAGLQEVGKTTIDTLKSSQGLVVLLPFVAFAGIIGWVYFRAKRGI